MRAPRQHHKTIATMTFLTVLGCSPRAPKHVEMKIGETITLTPIPQQLIETSELLKKKKKLLLTMFLKSKPLDATETAKVVLYGDVDETQVLHSFAGGDYFNLYRSTGCGKSDVAYLDNTVKGDTLICDGSVDLSKVMLFKVITTESKEYRATSTTYNFENDDVLALTVTLSND